MTKRLNAAIAVLLVATVCGLGLHVALHWHGETCGDQACQACHAGHTAMPQPLAHFTDQPNVPVRRFVASEAYCIQLAPVRTHRIPRAPPA